MDQLVRIRYIVILLSGLGESCTPKNEMIYHFVSQCLDPPLDNLISQLTDKKRALLLFS